MIYGTSTLATSPAAPTTLNVSISSQIQNTNYDGTFLNKYPTEPQAMVVDSTLAHGYGTYGSYGLIMIVLHSSTKLIG